MVLAGLHISQQGLFSQQMVEKGEEYRSALGQHLVYRKLEVGAGGLPVRVVLNAHFTRDGSVWMTAEEGLVRWDGLELTWVDQHDFAGRGLRPVSLYQIDDYRILVTYGSRKDHGLTVEAMAIVDTWSLSQTVLSLPESRSGLRWQVNKSGKGIFISHSQGAVYYLDVNQLQWLNEKAFPVSLEPISHSSYASGVLMLLHQSKNKKYGDLYKVSEQGSQMLVSNTVPLISDINGRFHLTRMVMLTQPDALEVMDVDPISSVISRVKLPMLIDPQVMVDLRSPPVFFTHQTGEMWAYDDRDGVLTAVDLRTHKVTRILHFKELVGNHAPSLVATNGQDVLMAIGPNVWLVRTSPMLIRQSFADLGSIRSFAQWQDKLLVGGYQGNYVIKLPANWSPRNPIDSLVTRTPLPVKGVIVDILSDRGGFWVSQSSRLEYLEGGSWAPSAGSTLEVEPCGDIWDVDRQGNRLLLGTDDGLRQFDPLKGQWSALPKEVMLRGKRIYGFLSNTPSGHLAFGEGGFYALEKEGDAIEKASPVFPVCSKLIVTHVYREAPDTWWVSTLQGLYVLDPLTGRLKFKELGLFMQGVQVYAVYPDEANQLWVPSEKGLYHIDPDRRRAYLFGRRDGLIEPEFNRNAHLRLSDGRLVFGSVSGMVLVDPQHVVIPEPPVVYFQRSAYRIIADGVNLAYELSSGIQLFRLPSQVRTLSLQTRDLYGSCTNCRFAWRFKGRDTDWRVAVGTALAIDEVPNGNCTVELWREVDGHWMQMPDVQLRLPHPLWWWMLWIVLLLGAMVGLVYVFRRSRRWEVVVSRPLANDVPAESSATIGAPLEQVVEGQPVEPQSQVSGWARHFEERLEQHYMDPDLDVGRMAELMNVSNRHMSRKCREHTGMTPNEFLLDFRLQKARQMMHEDPLTTISEIAYNVGFRAPGYFTRCFSAKFGLLPSAMQSQILANQKKD